MTSNNIKICLIGVLIVAAICSGCGVQQGKYVVTGDTYLAFVDRVGGIEIVDGFENNFFNTNEQLSPDLLYIIVVGPPSAVHGGGMDMNDKRIISTFNLSWDSDLKSFNTSIKWNRKTDIVSIRNRDFPRLKGNAFLITTGYGEKDEVNQITNFIRHCSFKEILRSVKEQASKSNPIQSAELVKY